MNTPMNALCGWATIPLKWDRPSPHQSHTLPDDQDSDPSLPGPASEGARSSGDGSKCRDIQGAGKPIENAGPSRRGGWLPSWMERLAEIIHSGTGADPRERHQLKQLVQSRNR
jgi:hypothetical protein